MAESAKQLRELASVYKRGIEAHGKRSLAADSSAAPAIAQAFRDDLASTQARLDALTLSSESKDSLLDSHTRSLVEYFQGNIENLIGSVKVPTGLAGPISVSGLYSRGFYLLPLATHEAALVASYHRGALAINSAGGCVSAVLNEGVTRSPGFAFESLAEAGTFAVWSIENLARFKVLAEETTSHGKLIDLKVTLEGSNVYLGFEYSTADASGQNMVTLATEAVCAYIAQKTPVKPRHWFVEANLSGDKKASGLSFMSVRGKKVSAEARLSAEVLKRSLKTTARAMENYWRMSAMGGTLSGTIGVQGQYANGLAALYIATGQDAACIAESAIGTTRFEARDDGSLYAAVTLPGLIVGTVGGGTSLPSQNACLQIMNLAGEGHAWPSRGIYWFLAVSFCNGVLIEFGRKIRSPETEETGVETYTYLWGCRGAAAAWTLALGCNAIAATLAPASIDFLLHAVAILACLFASGALLAWSFARQPNLRKAKRIEVFSGIWTVLMYLCLGPFPIAAERLSTTH